MRTAGSSAQIFLGSAFDSQLFLAPSGPVFRLGGDTAHKSSRSNFTSEEAVSKLSIIPKSAADTIHALEASVAPTPIPQRAHPRFSGPAALRNQAMQSPARFAAFFSGSILTLFKAPYDLDSP